MEYDNIKKQIEVLISHQEKNKEVEEKLEKLKNKVINLYDKSKIIVYFRGTKLNFLIFYTGTVKKAYG